MLSEAELRRRRDPPGKQLVNLHRGASSTHPLTPPSIPQNSSTAANEDGRNAVTGGEETRFPVQVDSECFCCGQPSRPFGETCQIRGPSKLKRESGMFITCCPAPCRQSVLSSFARCSYEYSFSAIIYNNEFWSQPTTLTYSA